jgi:hypothetical protein
MGRERLSCSAASPWNKKNQRDIQERYFCVIEGTKQIFEVEEKPFTSSLNSCTSTEACCSVEPSTSTLFPSKSGDISFKDDVTIILLLGVFFLIVQGPNSNLWKLSFYTLFREPGYIMILKWCIFLYFLITHDPYVEINVAIFLHFATPSTHRVTAFLAV